MAELVVSISAGVIASLLEKLRGLLKVSKHQEEIYSLQAELALLSAAMYDDSEMMEAQSMQVEEWRRQVREVAYDIDDFIDLYEHHLQRSKSRSIFSFNHGFRGFDGQLKRLKARVVDASERLMRYGLPVNQVPSSEAATAAHARSGSVTIDPRLFSFGAGDPVAIEGPKKELVQFLSDDQPHVKVVSIVGMAGIGKTTLAVQVYRELEKRFQNRAFVRVGPRPSVTTVLLNIISQVTGKQHNHEDRTEHKAIQTLRDFLHNQRYLIVVDDIWSISVWKAIICALPLDSVGSRIIVTTCIHDVARSCSNHPSDISYEMRTLSKPDTINLFHRRIFGSEKKCQKSECTQIHGTILKICGGLPWTIIAVASFLAMQEPKEWENIVNKWTLLALEKHPLLERMRKMLHLSYTNLPLSIKTCLLYLSVFPENYEINKDRLIWRWIAEGFISGRGDEGVWETGRSYFNELINRNLIQPMFVNNDDDNEDDPMGCVVHAMIHDFVVSLSREKNFVTFESMPRDVIRRLSLNYNNQDAQSTMLASLDESKGMNLSQTRSFTILGRPPQWRPQTMSRFKLLRVLDLEDAEGLDNEDIKDIGRLFNLRYLGLGGKLITELPKGIRKLQLLETLEIRRTEVRGLPQGAGQLQKLVRLLAKALDVIPAGVLKKMKELQELSVVSVNSPLALNLVEELAMMERLRILEIKWGLREEDSDIQDYKNLFITFLNRTSESNIKSLSIYCDEACSIDFVADSWDLPYLLEKLVIERSSSEQYLCRIPRKLASCHGLTHLDTAINLDVKEDLLVIANLPSLTSLKLSARGKLIVISSQGFQCLKVFCFQHREGDLRLLFEPGAMPQLRKLSLHFKVLPHQPQLQLETNEEQHADGCLFVLGLQHLSCLKQVNVKIDCDGATHTDVASVEEAIQTNMHVDGRNFKFELSRENEDKMKQDRGEGECRQLLGDDEDINISIGEVE